MYASNPNSFADLMSLAKQNTAQMKKKVANIHLLPETGRPKKVDPKQRQLKEGVAKFLAKQQEEERKKKEEEKIKKEKLLQLRQQDRKATNRVRKMLSMTKSANKSCVDDARDCLNESIAAQGEIQPDEDDYGYTSNYADMMHKKMMEKYKSIPVKPAFPQDRNAPPVPKHQSLSKNGTGWRGKNGTSHDHEDEKGYSSPEQERYEEPVNNHKKPEKPKPNRPPPLDYALLLKIAEEKKFEPAVPLKPVIEKKGELDEFEFGRPMTAKEKKQYLADKEIKDRLARRMADKNNNSSGSSSASVASNDSKVGKMPSFKIPKARSNTDETPPAAAAPPPKKPRVSEPEPSSSSRPIKEVPKARPSEPIGNGISSKSSAVPNSKPNGVRPPSSNGMSSRPPEKSQNKNSASSSSPPAHSSKLKGDSQRDRPDRPSSASHPPKPDPKIEKIIQERKELIKEKPRYLSAFNGGKEREKDRDPPKKQPLLSKDSNKPKPGRSRDMYASSRDDKYDSRDKRPAHKVIQMDRPLKRRDPNGMDTPPRREIAPSSRKDMGPPPRRDMEPPSRRDSEPPSRREMPMKGPSRMRDEPPRMRPPNHKPQFRGRAVIDSDEEEYDSEMDDFIDDSEVDMDNISAEISRIFKYDRRKYNYEESDDECMESSVAEQLREEQRSLRIGIQEDLEDIRREEEEKRRMKMLKKRR